jgi:hypothetical protein
MAFGLPQRDNSDFLPIVKIDAKAGRVFRMDRLNGEDKPTAVDITNPPPRFAVDFGTLEIGFIHFDANGPDFRLAPVEGTPPEMPVEKDEKGRFKHRQGFRLKLYGKRSLDGVRELSSTAVCVVQRIEDLYLRYKQSPEASSGRIPVVELTGFVPVVTGKVAKTTSYAPLFKIVDWIDRPSDVLGERTVPIPVLQPAKTAAQVGSVLVDDDVPF